VNVNFSATRDEDLGVIPRAISEVFDKIQKQASTAKVARIVSIKCSFYQIYNERVYDLLNPKFDDNVGLRMRWNAEIGFYLENLFEIECTTPLDVLHHYQKGVKNKIMASHSMNDTSSRAHSVFTMHLESTDPSQPTDIWRSKLTMVDLAGSERQGQTKCAGAILKESIHINKSLVVLRRVIKHLAEKTSR
jgi:hypothetical protein